MITREEKAIQILQNILRLRREGAARSECMDYMTRIEGFTEERTNKILATLPYHDTMKWADEE